MVSRKNMCCEARATYCFLLIDYKYTIDLCGILLWQCARATIEANGIAFNQIVTTEAGARRDESSTKHGNCLMSLLRVGIRCIQAYFAECLVCCDEAC